MTETGPISDASRPRSGRRIIFAILILLVITMAGVVIAAYQESRPPADFPSGAVVTVPVGSSVAEIAAIMAKAGVVRSELMLYLVILANHDPTELKASDYRFSEPMTVFEVADRLAAGDFTSNLIRVILKEGESISMLEDSLAALLPELDVEGFVHLASPYEGRLFPETYHVPPTVTPEELLDLMLATYESNLEPLRPAIEASDLTEAETITMASIVEREANSKESMRMVAGILQNRLAIGMALQVDSSLEYILDKPLSALTPEDLELDTPYNTYLYPGLTPTPIGNPGLDAINAVIYPIESDYLYYITGTDGQFHYARDFDEHRANIANYLR